MRLWVSHRRHPFESRSRYRLVLFTDPDTLRADRADWTAARDAVRDHATGVADKAQSIRTLTALYRDAHDGHVLTIGIARAPSETCLLQAVDVPLVIESAGLDAARLIQKVPTARLIHPGPGGWNQAILEAVDGRVGRLHARAR